MSRPFGSTNKPANWRAQQLTQKLEAHRFDCVAEFVRNYDDLKPDEKAQSLLALMSFLYPRQKAVTLSIEPQGDDSTDMHLEQLKALLDDPIAEKEVLSTPVCPAQAIAIK